MRSGDIYVIADETRGRIDAPPGIPVIRTSSQTIHDVVGVKPLVQTGYFGSANPLCWNLDYLVYRFFAEQPGYDYCLMMDYDAWLNLDVDEFVSAVAARSLDFVAHPHADMAGWAWAKPHEAIYRPSELQGCMLAVTVIARGAADYLVRQRREMAQGHESGGVGFWPFCEAFMPTELRRGGFRKAKLAEFGNTEDYG